MKSALLAGRRRIGRKSREERDGVTLLRWAQMREPQLARHSSPAYRLHYTANPLKEPLLLKRTDMLQCVEVASLIFSQVTS